MTLAAPPLQDAIGVDLQPWREGVKEEHIEQLYCGLGEASLRIQVPFLPSSPAAFRVSDSGILGRAAP